MLLLQPGNDDEASMIIDTVGESAAPSSNLLVSSIDGNVEQAEAPDSTSTGASRIRISGALGGALKLAAANKNKTTLNGGEEEAAEAPTTDKEVVSLVEDEGGSYTDRVMGY